MDSVHSLCALWPTEGGAHLRSLLPKETTTTPLKSILSFCQSSNSKHVFSEKTSKNFFLFYILWPTKTRPRVHLPRQRMGIAEKARTQPREIAEVAPRQCPSSPVTPQGRHYGAAFGQCQGTTKQHTRKARATHEKVFPRVLTIGLL